MRSRVLAIALSLVAVLGLGVPSAAAAAVPPPKIVIIVGPVGTAKYASYDCGTVTMTAYYRCIADQAAADAVKANPAAKVVKLYSPNATWAAVQPALQGADFVIYLGHGNGFPSPYGSSLNVKSQDGLGLNAAANQGDSNTAYYGEWYFANYVRLAPNAVVILSHLCYASGNSEPQYAAPRLSVAEQRIDDYAAGFIAAGARAVIAESFGDPGLYFAPLFASGQSVQSIWQAMPSAHGRAATFPSLRDPGFAGWYDPDTTSGVYHRSLVVRPGLSTTLVSGTPYASTAVDPPTFIVPGAASVTGGGTLKTDSTLTTATSTTLPTGTPVRLLTEATPLTDGTRVFQVGALDGSTLGYLAATSLIPRDSVGPAVWGVDDMGGTFSPNGDGYADTFRVRGQFSESVSYTVRFTSADGSKTYSTVSGSGSLLSASWNGASGSTPLPDGSYRWALHATDAWGNPALDTAASVIVDRSAATRIGGADRYAVAAAISAATFAPGVPVAYVATGLNFPDALAGAAAAAKAGGPVLLVNDTIPASIATELGRLKPGRIVVLGGSGSVSDAVAAALAAYTAGGVTRIGGADRYVVAAGISRATFPTGAPVAYLATGLNFPDALGGAAAAARAGAPMLLVTPTALPAATATELARLKPAKLVVLGGTGSVPAAIVQQAQVAAGATTVARIGGADRYAVAAAISAATFAPGVPVAYVATGLNFPDALAGAAAAAKAGGPVLLVNDTIPASIATELGRLKPGRIVVLGGSGSVSDYVRVALGGFLP